MRDLMERLGQAGPPAGVPGVAHTAEEAAGGMPLAPAAAAPIGEQARHRRDERDAGDQHSCPTEERCSTSQTTLHAISQVWQIVRLVVTPGLAGRSV